MIDNHPSEVKHHERMSALQNKTKNDAQENTIIRDRISPLSTEPNKNHNAQMYLLESQSLLREIFKDPPIIYYKRGKSLQDILIRIQ